MSIIISKESLKNEACKNGIMGRSFYLYYYNLYLISEETANNMLDNLYENDVDLYNKLLVNIWTFLLSCINYQYDSLKNENESFLIYLENYNSIIISKLFRQLELKIKKLMSFDDNGILHWSNKNCNDKANANINESGGYVKIVFQKI